MLIFVILRLNSRLLLPVCGLGLKLELGLNPKLGVELSLELGTCGLGLGVTGPDQTTPLSRRLKTVPKELMLCLLSTHVWKSFVRRQYQSSPMQRQ